MTILSLPIVAALTIGVVLNITPKKNSPVPLSLEWKNLPDAVQHARTSGKKILIDVFTDWCTWCKKMDKDVYSQESIQQYLRTNFELVKLDAESETMYEFRDGKYSEKQIASTFGVDGYPTTIFLTTDAGMITAVPGYLPPKTFSAVLEFIHGEEYKNTTWEEYSKKKGVHER